MPGADMALIEFGRKPAEVMNCPRRRHRGHCGTRDIPMSGDIENGSWARKRTADGCPTLSVGIQPQRVQRISVTEENGGHPRWHYSFKSVA